jgi:hypothetical protein
VSAPTVNSGSTVGDAPHLDIHARHAQTVFAERLAHAVLNADLGGRFSTRAQAKDAFAREKK